MKQETKTPVLVSIRRKVPYLNPALRRIGDYTLRYPQVVKSLTIGELASKCEVSESTITRFVKELNVRSFPELKILIAEDLSRSKTEEEPEDSRYVYEDIGASDDARTIARKIQHRVVDTLSETLEQLDVDAIERAVDAIENSDILAFFAVGSSTLAVENGLLRFLRVGKTCLYFEEQAVQQMSAMGLDKRATAIAVSNSGRTQAVVTALANARRCGATTVCVTAFPNAPIAEHADIKIITPTTMVPFGNAEHHESMTSKFAQLAVMDIIYSRFAVRNFDKSIEQLEQTNSFMQYSRLF